jgi:hypothetical protein
MRKFLVFILLLMVQWIIYADKIVVWNLKPQTGVTDKESITVTSILTSEIEQISKMVVIGESEVRSVIDGETIRASCGIDDNSCIAEVGATLGAPFSISGILSKMGDYWVITLQLVDVKKVEIKSRVTKKFKGDVNSLIESLTPLVKELFGHKETSITTDSAVEKPPVAETKPVEVKEEVKQEPEKKVEKKDKTPVSWKKAAGWTFTVTGALVLAGGIVSNVMMNSARDEFIKTGNSADEDKFKMFRGLSIGGYVAGSVFIAGGITLLVLDAVAPERKKENVSFYVVPFGDGFTAGLQGRW